MMTIDEADKILEHVRGRLNNDCNGPAPQVLAVQLGCIATLLLVIADVLNQK